MWRDGKVYKGRFHRTKFHGDGVIYYPSGQIAEGVWDENHNRSLSKLDNRPSDVRDEIERIKASYEKNSRPVAYSQQGYRQSDPLRDSDKSSSHNRNSSEHNRNNYDNDEYRGSNPRNDYENDNYRGSNDREMAYN